MSLQKASRTGIILYMASESWINKMVQRVIERFDPIKLILFGSHARENAGPDSDVDLLVVFPQMEDKRRAAVEIRKALADFPICKDIIVTSPEEIAERGDVIGSILRPALREGKVLYERT